MYFLYFSEYSTSGRRFGQGHLSLVWVTICKQLLPLFLQPNHEVVHQIRQRNPKLFLQCFTNSVEDKSSTWIKKVIHDEGKEIEKIIHRLLPVIAIYCQATVKPVQ